MRLRETPLMLDGYRESPQIMGPRQNQTRSSSGWLDDPRAALRYTCEGCVWLLAGALQGFADRQYDAVTATYLWLCERGKLRL